MASFMLKSYTKSMLQCKGLEYEYARWYTV